VQGGAFKLLRRNALATEAEARSTPGDALLSVPQIDPSDQPGADPNSRQAVALVDIGLDRGQPSIAMRIVSACPLIVGPR
jgi:hypothetical protein